MTCLFNPKLWTFLVEFVCSVSSQYYKYINTCPILLNIQCVIVSQFSGMIPNYIPVKWPTFLVHAGWRTWHPPCTVPPPRGSTWHPPPPQPRGSAGRAGHGLSGRYRWPPVEPLRPRSYPRWRLPGHRSSLPLAQCQVRSIWPSWHLLGSSYPHGKESLKGQGKINKRICACIEKLLQTNNWAKIWKKLWYKIINCYLICDNFVMISLVKCNSL